MHRLCVTVTFTHAQKFGIITTIKENECEAEHICVWALTHLLSIYRSHEGVKLLKTLFLFD